MPQKNILITGCSPGGRGIGAALARAFQLQGHRVFASGLDETALAPLRALGIETLILDVTDEKSIAAAVEHVRGLTETEGTKEQAGKGWNDDQDGEKDGSNMATIPRRRPRRYETETGRLDILVNNAGLLHTAPFADMDIADARRLFDVNILGVFAVTQAFLPLLVAAADDSKRRARAETTSSSSSWLLGGWSDWIWGARAAAAGGTVGAGLVDSVVANLGSINAHLRPPFFSTYNASKAAIEALGGTLRVELAPLGVRVVTVKTGCVDSDLVGRGLDVVTVPVPGDGVVAPEEEGKDATTPAAAKTTSTSKWPRDGSLYDPLREYIEEKRMLDGQPFMDADEYANGVVTQLLRAPRPRPLIWKGGLSGMGWVLTWFGWEGMADAGYIKGLGLDAISRE